MIRIGCVGLGHWGPNLARNVASAEGAVLQALCDAIPERLAQLGASFPAATTTTDLNELLADPHIDALILATPAATHFALAKAALEAGKHVLVEKPLAKTADECRTLIALAEERGLTLMVGHVFLYNAAVRRVKAMIDAGELGELYYVYSQRLNRGIVRQDVNALWNFAPHDLSILSYWLGAPPTEVEARGFAYLQPGIEDVVFLTMTFPGGVGASVHLSWLDPNKVRRMTIVGSKKMVLYDDMSPDAKVVVYDKGISRAEAPAALGTYQDFGSYHLLARAGDVVIPKLEQREPLRVEIEDFVRCVRDGARPLADGLSGLHVVEALEAAQRSLTER